MKPRTQFGRIAKPLPVHRKDPFAASAKWNAEHEERAAIHEFDGRLPRAEAEALAAAECQHCGAEAELITIFRVDYGYNLDVCEPCAEALTAAGWERGAGPQPERLF